MSFQRLNKHVCEACSLEHQECARMRRLQFADVTTCCCDNPVRVQVYAPPGSYAHRQKLEDGMAYEAIDRRYLGDGGVVVNRDGHGIVLWVDQECRILAA